MSESISTGATLCDIRKRRGLSQKGLSEASGVSISLIRKLEQGQVDHTRLETAHKLATALRVPTTHLLDRHESPEGADTDSSPDAEAWAPVRHAVERPPTDTTTEAPTLEGVQAAADAVGRAWATNQLATAATLLPPALRDAEALGDEGREAHAYVLQLAGALLTQTRQYDAAETALRQALDAAQGRHRSASVAGTMCWLAIRQGRLTQARTLATRWADDVEPRVSRATAADLAAWGGLLLHLASACVRDNRPGEAADALRFAQAAAVMTGHELPVRRRMGAWGPLTVAYKRAEQHMIVDRPDKVLEIAEGTEAHTSDAGRVQNGFNRHQLDVAAAHVRMRQHAQAVKVLSGVHARVPEWLAQQRYAKDILGDVVKRRRTLTPEMRRLVDAVGLPL
ncbi:helix-turn-helix domain-containing protein [Streptomyces buecherae]|uniref:Helix-turn-helix transcriptional regulator n=1 Tax=Streptomyces buecherae TaxID=2763006 RepID=A0A7H8N7J6_9ACTN|nr:helix-turn-helix transcriptional regulator [Streptomyces buecherae]QKW50286.1 helix-turn-helix transcriptional regulator [Streptomyces buecherae]